MSSIDFIRGQWLAYGKVLDYLNTLENKQVDKRDIYHKVFDMRPITLEEYFKINE